jgi:glycerol uptake facilitator-like aquaporin
MKKIILNEWTFVISLLTFIFVCFLSTGFRDDSYADIVINFFGSLMLIALVISVLYVNVSKKLQRVVVGFVIVMLIISLSSCGVSRNGRGCPDTQHLVGYR